MSSSTTSPSSNTAISGLPGSVANAANASGSKLQSKMTTTGKALDGARKQAASPVDATTQRKQAPRVAWGRDSPNPVTGRTNNASNGVPAQSRAAASPKSPATPLKEPAHSDRHANDRYMFLVANFLGRNISLTLKNGERYGGVFVTASFHAPRPQYLLKMVKKLSPSHGQANGVTEAADEYISTGGADHAMSFDIQDVAGIAVDKNRLEKLSSRGANGVSSSFKTDTDISGNVGGRERVLQKWEPSGDVGEGLSLESDHRGWDQFEVNARLFGLKTDYDETYYTTTIDRSKPGYDKIAAKAERLQREIEGEKVLSTQTAGERGVPDDSGIDEEMKYSSVVRSAPTDFPPLPSGQPNKYTPPARRPPTGQPTVPGAPVDPAIISSTLAKPGPAASKPATSESATPKSSEKAAVTVPETIPIPGKGTEKAEPTAVSQAQTTESKQKSGAEQAGNTKTAPALAATKPAQPPAVSPARPANKEGVAATVEKDVVTAFKNFSAHEKLRAAEQQRRQARQDKAVKLNDLKKFAENFKLHTPVPTDLVPILAKDKSKQEEIMKKNQANIAQAKSTPTKQPTSASAPSTDKPTKAVPSRNDVAHASPVATQDRQGQPRGRHNQNNFGQSVRNDRAYPSQQMQNIPVRHQVGNLGPRLQNNMSQAQYRQGLPAMAIPGPPFSDPRAPPTGPSATSSGVTSPTSAAARFNIKAPEFRPNPAAHTFQPSHSPSSTSSPAREPSNRPVPVEQKPKKGNFFEGRRAVLSPDQRVDIEKDFNPIPRMKKEAENERTHDGYKWNQGVRPAFHTEPRWPVPKENEDKTYDQMFEQPRAPQPSVSPQHPALAQPPMPHHQQLPMHLQHGPPMPQGPQYTPRHMPSQPHHVGPSGPHHFDDHQMRFSQSTSSVHPSPRAMPPFVAYNGPGPQGVPIYQNAMPAYGMSPGGHPMAVRQVSNPPQFIAPQGQPMGGHMMTNQPSSGPYMNVPMNAQVQMYSPMGAQVFPQHGGPMPPQQIPNGYPNSPARGPAPMMAHQGSQQGHGPQQMVYMQPGSHGPMFNQGPQGPMTPMRGGYGQPHPPHQASPYQQPMYPVQPHRGTPSATYAQPMMPTHSMPPQTLTPNVNATQMGGDGREDVK